MLVGGVIPGERGLSLLKTLHHHLAAIADPQNIEPFGQSAHIKPKLLHFAGCRALQHHAAALVVHFPADGLCGGLGELHRDVVRCRAGRDEQARIRAAEHHRHHRAVRKLPVEVHLAQAVVVDAGQRLLVCVRIVIDHRAGARAGYLTDGFVAGPVGAALNGEVGVVDFGGGREGEKGSLVLSSALEGD